MASRRKKGPSRKASPRQAATPPARPPAAQHLIVQFRADGDPSPQQTEAVRSILRRFAGQATVQGEFPGAMRVVIAPEAETAFRESVELEKDWSVSSEGTAQMPPKPLPP